MAVLFTDSLSTADYKALLIIV